MARAVQISFDPELLERIDADPEVRREGRSAFVQTAVRSYLESRDKEELDTRIAKAYAGEADALLAEIEPLLGRQTWPTD